MSYQVLVGTEFKDVESLWKGVYLTRNNGGMPIRDALAGYIRDTDFAKELIKGFKSKDLLDALLCNAGHYNYTEGITHNPLLISEGGMYVSHRSEAEFDIFGDKPFSLICVPDKLSRVAEYKTEIELGGLRNEVLTLNPNTTIDDGSKSDSEIYVAPTAHNTTITTRAGEESSIYCYAPNCTITVQKEAQLDNLYCTGRGSLVILEGGSSVGNICIEGGVEVRGINGTTWGISPGRLLTQLNERR